MKMKVNFRGEVILEMSALSVLSGIITVDRESGYGREAKYIPNGHAPEIEIIQDDQLVTSEVETMEILKKKAAALESEKSAEWLKAYNAQQKVDALTKELEAIRSVCPHPKEPAEKGEAA